MTSEPTSEAPRAERSPPLDGEADRRDDVARLYLRISLVFLAVASLLFLGAAARLAFPDSFTTVPLLAYGRLAPVAFNLFAYGWLTIGLIAAGYYIVPRVSGIELQHRRLAVAGAGLMTVGFLGGAIGVALGGNEGRQYLEAPLWADAAVILGLLAVVRVFTGTIASSEREHPLAPSEWYFGSAPIWLLLAYLVGNVPGLVGVNSSIQTAFYRGALFGMWFVAAGVGVVYFLVSSMSGADPRRITQLTVAGFWSLPFVFALSAGSRLTYTAAPDWLETIAGVFSIALFLPVAIVLVDLASALAGSRAGRGDTTLRLLVAGAVAFAVVPVVNLALSVRSSSAVVGQTEWVTALDTIALFGVFSLWLFAFVHHVALAPARGFGHYAVSVVAVSVIAGSMLVSGVQAGLTWLASANSGAVSAGEGFEATARAADVHLWVRLVGFAVFALAQVWLLVAVGRNDMDSAAAAVPMDDTGGADGNGEDGEVSESAEASDSARGGLPDGVPVPIGKLRAGTVGIFAMVALFAFVLPLFEAGHRDPTALADSVRSYDDDVLAQGRLVYLAEGCWYCHTQEVRGIVTDVGLGSVAQPGDYANEAPTTAGIVRLGPDLMFAGSRDINAFWVETFLANPRAVRPWSTMPAHDYLGDGDVRALAAYIAGLRLIESG